MLVVRSALCVNDSAEATTLSHNFANSKPYSKNRESGTQMGLFDEKKTRGRKSCDTVPLNNIC
jgi:hypothetical protein